MQNNFVAERDGNRDLLSCIADKWHRSCVLAFFTRAYHFDNVPHTVEGIIKDVERQLGLGVTRPLAAAEALREFLQTEPEKVQALARYALTRAAEDEALSTPRELTGVQLLDAFKDAYFFCPRIREGEEGRGQNPDYVRNEWWEWKAMSPAVQALRLLMAKLYRAGDPVSDDLRRPIHVTPFEGAYGRAGYVITIQGSPPKGTLVVLTHHCPMEPITDHATITFMRLEKATVIKQPPTWCQTKAQERDEGYRRIVGQFLKDWNALQAGKVGESAQ